MQTFIRKFEPAHQAVIRAARKALRKRFPTATELAYDNYNFFVIGYGPTERPSDCIVSIAAAANGVGLCFIHGAALPDPKKILGGSGKQTRFCVCQQRRFFNSLPFQTPSPLPSNARRHPCQEKVEEADHSLSVSKAAAASQTSKGLTLGLSGVPPDVLCGSSPCELSGSS